MMGPYRCQYRSRIFSPTMKQPLSVLAVLLALAECAFAVMFHLPAYHQPDSEQEKCLRLWMTNDTPVKIKARAHAGEDQTVSLRVSIRHFISRNAQGEHGDVSDLRREEQRVCVSRRPEGRR